MLKTIKLKLGKLYSVGVDNHRECGLFIKTTPKGYNFLDLQKAECIMKQHIYAKTKYGNGEISFTVDSRFMVEEINLNRLSFLQ